MLPGKEQEGSERVITQSLRAFERFKDKLRSKQTEFQELLEGERRDALLPRQASLPALVDFDRYSAVKPKTDLARRQQVTPCVRFQMRGLKQTLNLESIPHEIKDFLKTERIHTDDLLIPQQLESAST